MQTDTSGELARKLLSQIFSLFLSVYVVLAIIVALAAPYIVSYVFPGMEGNTEEVVLLLRILLLQPMLLGISSLFGVVTQLGHRFVLYAVSPLIYNIGIIIGIVVLYPHFGLSGLVYGVVLGAFGHMAVQFPLVRTSVLSFGFDWKINWKDVRSVLAVSIPRAATLAMHQVVLLVLVAVAGLMTVGSVAVFQFAYNLQSVPLAVIGASYSIAAFPLLADLYAQKKMDTFRLHIVSALRHIVFWSVPAIGLIVVLRAQMVRVVLGSGAFDWGDTRLTAAVLALLSVSLFAQAINLLIVRVFYAGGFTRIPFVVTFFGSLAAVGSVIGLYTMYTHTPDMMKGLESFMRVSEVPGAEVMVIALGYSAAMILQMFLLLVSALHVFAIPVRGLLLHMVRATAAAFAGGFSAYAALNFFVFGINEETLLGIFLQGMLGAIAGLLGVVSMYYVLRTPELNEIYRSCRGRIFKTDVVAVQDEIL